MSDNIEVFPLTITIPQSFNSTSVVEIVDSYASMRAVFVERDSIYDIPDIWRNSCGFYILFSRIKGDGSYSVYVGKSNRDFTKRLRSHDMNKDGWTTALLVQRNSIQDLSSTQSSYLEGALRDIFEEASHVKCYNIAPTGDRTLPIHERLLMKQVIESTLRIMLIRGYRKSLPVPSGSLIPDAAPSSVSLTPPASRPSPQAAAAPPKITMSVPRFTPKPPENLLSPPTPLLTPELPVPALPAPQPVSMTPQPAPEKKTSLFSMLKRHEPAATEENLPAQAPVQVKPVVPEEVFQALRAWRVQKAREERLSPAYIFDDKVLRALAEQMPATYEELLTVPGIKETKRDKYGANVLEILDRYRLRALA